MPVKRPLRRHGDRPGADRAAALRAGAGRRAAPGTPADLLAWLRAPGRLERPELADSLERDVRRLGLTQRRAGARALGGAPLRRSTRSTGWRRPQRRGPGALAEQAARELLRLFAAPRRGRAALLDAEEMDEARALAGGRSALAELRELARVARRRRARDGRRAGRGAGAASRSTAASCPGRGSSRCSIRCSCARGACAPCSSPGCRRACSRCGRARTRCSPTTSARALAEASGLLLGEHQDVARGRALPALRGALAPRGAARAELARDRRRRGAAVALAVRRRRLRPVRREPLRAAARAGALGALDAGAPARRRAARAGARPARASCATSACSRRCAGASGRRRRSSAGSAARSRWFVERLLAPGAPRPRPGAVRAGQPRARGAQQHASRRCGARPAARA